MLKNLTYLLFWISCFFVMNAFSMKNPKTISDQFETYKDVLDALKDKGFDGANLIIAIDATGSNKTQGTNSYAPYFTNHPDAMNYENLHYISMNWQNPYQQVLLAIANTLEKFDEDTVIPTFIFGDLESKDKTLCELKVDGRCPHGMNEVLNMYQEYAREMVMSGPTSFAPAIRRAIEIANESHSYHILLLITDGKVTPDSLGETSQAIKDASKYPLSIIIVGVGDGPFNRMEDFDDNVKGKFDNCQFVDFTKITKKLYKPSKKQTEDEYKKIYDATMAKFAMDALMEVPVQYQYIQNYILSRPKKNSSHGKKRCCLL